MTISEFEDKLNIINSILFPKELFIEKKSNNYLDFINLSVDYFSSFKDNFIEIKRDNENNIKFILSSRPDDVFMIKKNQALQEIAPIVYIKIEENWTSYEFVFSTLFLTEYINWLSNNEKNKFEFHFSGYGIFTPIKKNWTLFFNPLGYPNKIWINNELKSVLLIQNESGTIKCISDNSKNMELIKQLLYIE